MFLQTMDTLKVYVSLCLNDLALLILTWPENAAVS